MSLYMHRKGVQMLEPLDGTIGGYRCFLPTNEDTIIAKIELDENLLFFSEAIKLFKSVKAIGIEENCRVFNTFNDEFTAEEVLVVELKYPQDEDIKDSLIELFMYEPDDICELRD